MRRYRCVWWVLWGCVYVHLQIDCFLRCTEGSLPTSESRNPPQELSRDLPHARSWSLPGQVTSNFWRTRPPYPNLTRVWKGLKPSGSRLRALLWLHCSLTSVQSRPSPLPQVLFLRAVASQPLPRSSPPHLLLPRKPDLSQRGGTSTTCYWMKNTNCRTVWIESFFANNKKKFKSIHLYMDVNIQKKVWKFAPPPHIDIFLIQGREVS